MSDLETLTERYRGTTRYTPMLLQFWRGLSRGVSVDALNKSLRDAAEANHFAAFCGDWPAARVTGKKMLRLVVMAEARKDMRSQWSRFWFARAAANYYAYTEFHGLEDVQ